VPFQGLDTLAEVVLGLLELVVLPGEVFERGAEQCLGLAEAFVNPVLVLGIAPFYESCEPFGHKPDLVAQVFDQHARMAFDLLEAVIDSLVDLRKLPVNRLEALVYRLESPVVPVQSLLNPAKPLIQVLNQFLIHTASAS
jgi:hypothetical protein